MNNNYDPTIAQVEEFHRVFNHPVESTLTIPSQATRKNRLKFILEELTELATACGSDTREDFKDLLIDTLNELDAAEPITNEVDLPQVLDALADLRYFENGTLLVFGLQKQFPGFFDEVHASNMSKACRTEDEYLATMLDYEAKGIDTERTDKDNLILVSRKSDGKILKNIYYTAANAEAYLKDYSQYDE